MEVSCYLIDSGYFCAGVIVEKEIVIDAAPIVRYMKNWDIKKVKDYCKKKKWKLVNEQN